VVANEFAYGDTRTFDGQITPTWALAVVGGPADGEDASQAIKPAGWREGQDGELQRGHLIARRFGGAGTGATGEKNLATMYRATNGGGYKKAENAVARLLQNCVTVAIGAAPIYHDGPETIDELWSRDRLPADSFQFNATSAVGPVYVGPNPILNRKELQP
jgi:hypothetical protein